MMYLFENQINSVNLYHVKLWDYTINDRIQIRAIQNNYHAPDNWQFKQPSFLR